jgi:hypothetical protein
MLIIPQIHFRSHRPRRAVQQLMLVSAVYNDDDDPMVTLVFNRPIDIAGLIATAIQVNDAQSRHQLFDAAGGTALLDPVTVRFTLEIIGASSGAGQQLTAEADNGIVAVGDGAAWAGATELALPFP